MSLGFKRLNRCDEIMGARSSLFCMMVQNICRSSIWILLHIALLAPRILKWLSDFWKICAPLSLTTII